MDRVWLQYWRNEIGEDTDVKMYLLYYFQELKDLKMKAEQVKRLMERGYRVKVLSFISLQDSLCIMLLIWAGGEEYPCPCPTTIICVGTSGICHLGRIRICHCF